MQTWGGCWLTRKTQILGALRSEGHEGRKAVCGLRARGLWGSLPAGEIWPAKVEVTIQERGPRHSFTDHEAGDNACGAALPSHCLCLFSI